MKLAFALLTIAVGMILPAQAGFNAEFRRHAGHPLLAATLNFGVGLLVLLVVTGLFRVELPTAGRLAQAPWWSWLGGLCGATLVFSTVIAAPRLGASLLVACLVAGQLVASMAIDHFGWVGYETKPIGTARIAGAALLMLGVVLIERS